jgi:hypothetical protein
MSFGKVLVEKLLFTTIIIANDNFSTSNVHKILGVCDNKHTS